MFGDKEEYVLPLQYIPGETNKLLVICATLLDETNVEETGVIRIGQYIHRVQLRVFKYMPQLMVPIYEKPAYAALFNVLMENDIFYYFAKVHVRYIEIKTGEDVVLLHVLASNSQIPRYLYTTLRVAYFDELVLDVCVFLGTGHASKVYGGVIVPHCIIARNPVNVDTYKYTNFDLPAQVPFPRIERYARGAIHYTSEIKFTQDVQQVGVRVCSLCASPNDTGVHNGFCLYDREIQVLYGYTAFDVKFANIRFYLNLSGVVKVENVEFIQYGDIAIVIPSAISRVFAS
jgi:hypothetical protein